MISKLYLRQNGNFVLPFFLWKQKTKDCKACRQMCVAVCF